MVICLELGAHLHMAQLMPLPLTVSCLSKIQIGFTFLVPAHPGSPGQRAIKRVCVCVCYLNCPYMQWESPENQTGEEITTGISSWCHCLSWVNNGQSINHLIRRSFIHIQNKQDTIVELLYLNG